jgi:hypothetical protein
MRFFSRKNTRFEIKDILGNLSIQEVESRLSRLNSYKTGGTDEVNPLMLKMCAKTLSVPLFIFFVNL